jgi:protoheme IX farnesyltransferase
MSDALAASLPNPAATDTKAKPMQISPAGFGDYVALLKPRVMSLVVFTALTGLFCADRPIHPITAFIAILCITVGAGASGALNMAYDADIDALMKRTKNRPVPKGLISRADATGFGVVLSLFSVMLMDLAVNTLSAAILAFTIIFYGLVYTVWLKRATPQNIVIGGAAGALPPVLGWAAASGHAPLNAWLLFAIIFIWTPPHFWALSLYTTTDYAKAGVPMMPVVKGAKSTRRQIFAYSIALALLGVAPLFTGLGGPLYAVVSIIGGGAFVALALRILLSQAGEKTPEGPQPKRETLYRVAEGAKVARDLFAVSIFYLFGLFAALLIEHGVRAAGFSGLHL